MVGLASWDNMMELTARPGPKATIGPFPTNLSDCARIGSDG
jgi:hypothetical protein